ncbi:chemotaxis protein CheW [Symbiobacterium thermophilum]|uniref:Chemotaxis protein CheW n=1 Tax=Symbiobacterium thermophilum TaxID=2734 RepID=A0A953IAI5_SYMTR|nr:chemotaxis protein CheW [Symbiobacterium thermophilum]MBY6277468.1 chemotaxis protein CheW [Symbiobacterium thermophilum]
MATSQQRTGDEQFVVFRLANEHYGLPIRSVREIIVLREVTRMPETASYVEGIVDLRGRIVPVINLRTKLGLPPGGGERGGRTVVTEFGDAEAGLVVDEVVGVMRVDASSIEAPPQMTDVDRRAVSAIARVQNRLVILLDLGAILEPSPEGLPMHHA